MVKFAPSWLQWREPPPWSGTSMSRSSILSRPEAYMLHRKQVQESDNISFQIDFWLLLSKIIKPIFLAQTRQKLLHTITSLTQQPHLPTNNHQTSFSTRYNTFLILSHTANSLYIVGCWLAPFPTRTRRPTTPGSSTWSGTKPSFLQRRSSMSQN